MISWNLSSRVHPLKHFPNQGVNCHVKREDELGCGISGSKIRKYASLMPYLLNSGIKHLIIIAGPQSNNLLAALQMAREFQLTVTVFLIKPHNHQIQGNFKLSRLFLVEQEIIWVERKEWPKVEAMADAYLNTLRVEGFVLKEGANVEQAMPGAISIAADIVKNERTLNLSFQHIFVDAGTGFSAAALIKGLDELNHKSTIYVLLLADDESTFRHKLHRWIGYYPLNVLCFFPETAKSFGSINRRIKNEIRRLALEEGILADPVYSAKLFLSARIYIENNSLQGNALLIHSGGALTMSGFDLI